MYTIDLNSDMGESFGAYRIGNDEGIIQHITSTNVPAAITPVTPWSWTRWSAWPRSGAWLWVPHPGYPDLMGFGRRKMTLSTDEVKNYMKYQIGA